MKNLYFEVVQGDDFKAVDGRDLKVFGIGSVWPTTISSVRMVVYDECLSTVLDVAGTYTPTSNAQPAAASFDLSRQQTLQLQTGVRRYDVEVRALLSTGNVITLARGLMTVLRGSY